MKIKLEFPGLLALLFIALKLTGFIAWSWWWVLSPLWIGLVLVLGFLCIAVAIGATITRKVKRW